MSINAPHPNHETYSLSYQPIQDDQRLHLHHPIHASNDVHDSPWHAQFRHSGLQAPLASSQPQQLAAGAAEYPSPPTSLSSPTHLQHPSHDNAESPLPFDSPQVDSRIGPTRVTTRGQRRALEASHRPSPYSPLGSPNHFKSSHRNISHSIPYLSSPTTGSCPGSPTNVSDPSMSTRHHHRSSLSDMGSAGHSPMRTHYPVTPDSPTHYDHHRYHHAHSPSNSTSINSHPRSASPALSAVTSLSSGSHPTHHSPHVPQSPQASASIGPNRVKQRKQRLYNTDRKAICQYHEANPTARQEDIAGRYGVERSTISKILKAKAKWLNVPTEEEGVILVAKHRPSKFPLLEEQMVGWLTSNLLMTTREPLSDNGLRTKAREIAHRLGISDDKFKASSGWVENFKSRHGIRGGIWHGDGRNTNIARSIGLGGGPLRSNEHGFLESTAPHTLTPSEAAAVDALNMTVDTPTTGNMAHGHHNTSRTSFRTVWPSHAPLTPSMNADPGPSASSNPSSMLNHSSHIEHQHDHPDTGDVHLPESISRVPLEPVQFTPSGEGIYPAVYQAIPPLPDHSPLTMPQAEESLNKLLEFFNNGEGRDILIEKEKSTLMQIKRALFQAASGVPFTRGGSP